MRATLTCLVTALLAVACGDSSSSSSNPAPFDPDQPYDPDVTADALSIEITNDLLPAPPGAMWVFESVTADGTEHIEVTVTSDEKAIASGATARVVRDTAWFDGEMIEDTRDWFAQDADGNVWYLGEDTAEYEGGEVSSTEGSWEWGVGDGLPGVVMLGAPSVGDTYRQEYLVGEAEDYAEIVSVDESVTVPAGTFEHCVETHESSVVETTLDENKFYCPGVGQVLTIEGDIREELIEYSGL
jgi:hypothetical protein